MSFLNKTSPFDLHIKGVTGVAFLHFHKIAKVRAVASVKYAEVLIHTFVKAKCDYYTVPLSGLLKKSFQGLQMVQNSAAHIMTGTFNYEHITPVLASFHRLPV